MLGGMEYIILILIVGAILIFGPKKLPELARAWGKSMAQLKAAKKEAEEELESLTPK